ncbi:uncharacterized protein K452DRAFT_120998 [Aplosporella prunicola CBS 121167]|uniref:Uncharacterized protein n=1 Tax=Aplosporella prunicola CBS 121167 TaxID=1176127 RepID=A0A6A6BPZ4_9PEZI|nr:uncharacterized protein K452DRAFT_120998 [Aplosporella prunicola CBS 121167]KAF2145513.1 hypothetical protein K452DRAFT_120998 [Aplosporella prunicola CBS 121167]
MYTTTAPVCIPSSARSSSMSSNDSLSGSPRGSSTPASSCAWPSWPSGKSFGSPPSSFISDEDLFGDDFFGSIPLLEEAPAPPRMHVMPQPPAAPLQPLYASPKHRSSSKSQRRNSKPMEAISETPSKGPE